eukprot:COSAG01_NODE_64269_length_277_cov_0.584270_2_plen_36_part_01
MVVQVTEWAGSARPQIKLTLMPQVPLNILSPLSYDI